MNMITSVSSAFIDFVRFSVQFSWNECQHAIDVQSWVLVVVTPNPAVRNMSSQKKIGRYSTLLHLKVKSELRIRIKLTSFIIAEYWANSSFLLHYSESQQHRPSNEAQLNHLCPNTEGAILQFFTKHFGEYISSIQR